MEAQLRRNKSVGSAPKQPKQSQYSYEEAKRRLDQALSADEGGDRMKALELYNVVLTYVSRATKEDRVHQDTKLEKMKEQVKARMEDLIAQETASRQKASSTVAMETSTTPPSMKSTVRSSVAGVTTTSTTRGSTGTVGVTTPRGSTGTVGVSSVRGGEKPHLGVGAKADLLFEVDSGVGMVQVNDKGHVTQFTDVDTFGVFRYQTAVPGQPPAFLQCGGFVYPLVPGKSPVLQVSEKMYILPALKGQSGDCVGIVFDSLSAEESEELSGLLASMALVKVADVHVATQEKKGVEKGVVKDEEWTSTVVGGIEKGTVWITTKLAQGTEIASRFISKGGSKVRENIQPTDKAIEVPAGVLAGARVARKASGCVVAVSDLLMTSLARLTVTVARRASDAVSESEVVQGIEINPNVKDAWKVTKSGVIGAASVFHDLEKSAVALLKAAGKETSVTVEHKYGVEAGQLTDDSLATAGHVADLTGTYWSWKTWGIKFLGKIGEVMKDEKKDTETLSHR